MTTTSDRQTKRPSRPAPATAAREAQAWNDAHLAGTKVEVTLDSGKSLETRTTSSAWVLGGHTAVVKVAGVSGSYLLSRVRAVEEYKDPAAEPEPETLRWTYDPAKFIPDWAFRKFHRSKPPEPPTLRGAGHTVVPGDVLACDPATGRVWVEKASGSRPTAAQLGGGL